MLGLAAALAIVFAGLAHLQRSSDAAATLRSKALAATLAARMRATPSAQRRPLLEHVARQTGASFFLIDKGGRRLMAANSRIEVDPGEVMALLDRGEGKTETNAGRRLHFATSSVTAPLSHLSVMAVVDAPRPAHGTVRMTNAVAVLTLLMLGVAIVVALIFMRAVHSDVDYVRRRVAEMARAGVAEGAAEGVTAGGAAVPVRSLDQVAVLTAALNVLIERFATAQRSYRADLQQAAALDTERSQFLAGLSHELRTPLNAVLGFTHLIETEENSQLSDEAHDAIEMIMTSGEHLKALIDDILDLSAAETGELRLSRRAVDVLTLAEEVVREARATLAGKALQLTVTGEHARAWADARRTRQVLTNLVANAVKATVQGSVVLTVRKHESAATTSISIADTGSGIAPQVLQTIFQPFQQAGDEKLRHGGAGLGLAIARRLVLLHGGTIDADSKVGRGSIFTVVLPDETHAKRVPQDSLVPWAEGSGIDGEQRAL